MSKALVLFAGVGGSTLGLRLAGFQTLSIEIDPDIAEIHKRNIGECQIADILEVNPLHIKIGIGIPDVIFLSPPCQAYSRASIGKGKATSKNREDRDILLELIAKGWFEVLESPYVVLENVPEYRKSESFTLWCSHLIGLGYNVRYDILNAYDFGIPTKRLRLFAVASKGDLPIIKCPYRHVGWHSVIGHLIEGMTDSSLIPVQEKYVLNNEVEYPILIERVGIYSGKPKVALGSEPIWTIRKSIGSDGKGANRSKFINVVDGDIIKDLSVQGLGMLQGFPANYQWGESPGVAVAGIGNSVCPPLAQAIGESIREVLCSR